MSKKTLGIVSSIFEKRIEKARKVIHDDEEERPRYKTVIDLVVGKHPGCGGIALYSSIFVPDESSSVARYGGKTPMKEETKCSCDRCGSALNPDFPPYRKKLEEYRASQIRP